MSTPGSTNDEGQSTRNQAQRASSTKQQQTTDNVVQLDDRRTTAPVDAESDVLTFYSGGFEHQLNRTCGEITKIRGTTKRAVLPFVPDVHKVMVDLEKDDLQDRKLYTISVGDEQSQVTHRQVLTGDAWANFAVSGYSSRGMISTLSDAVLRLAEEHEVTPLYRHMGWIEKDGRPVYLTARECIGADGPVPGPVIDLGLRTGAYALPAPPNGDQERDAVRASLDLLVRRA